MEDLKNKFVLLLFFLLISIVLLIVFFVCEIYYIGLFFVFIPIVLLAFTIDTYKKIKNIEEQENYINDVKTLANSLKLKQNEKQEETLQPNVGVEENQKSVEKKVNFIKLKIKEIFDDIQTSNTYTIPFPFSAKIFYDEIIKRWAKNEITSFKSLPKEKQETINKQLNPNNYDLESLVVVQRTILDIFQTNNYLNQTIYLYGSLTFDGNGLYCLYKSVLQYGVDKNLIKQEEFNELMFVLDETIRLNKWMS